MTEYSMSNIPQLDDYIPFDMPILAVRAKVLNITDERMDTARGIPNRIYKIEAKAVFRVCRLLDYPEYLNIKRAFLQNQLNVQPTPTQIYTDTPFAMDSCTARFDVGKEYLIFGKSNVYTALYLQYTAYTLCSKK